MWDLHASFSVVVAQRFAFSETAILRRTMKLRQTSSEVIILILYAEGVTHRSPGLRRSRYPG